MKIVAMNWKNNLNQIEFFISFVTNPIGLSKGFLLFGDLEPPIGYARIVDEIPILNTFVMLVFALMHNA